ncbi:hypothetical protein UFOVP1615_30 [uncultured Caudovirales phage]|jgi:hypothetical protein|uniref:Uncharacterized protein n=1 Tax=uncultured Caudovirales phage TaxID=2100421 RepID=A0A6J5SXW7_9CAUD|nr:hypothetical protein UFOVP1615_30 [uncultured Caudovirales phage]
MPNIEKQFIDSVLSKHPEAEKCLFYLLESDVLNFDRMKYYLIRKRYSELIAKSRNVQKMIIYADIAEEFCTTADQVRQVIHYR